MIRKASSLIVCALVLGLVACSEAPPPPPDTRAADEKAIRDLIAADEKAWAAKDVDKIASFYADDATVFATDMKMIAGMADIKPAIKGFLDTNFTFQNGPSIKVDVSKAGDMAYAQGTATAKFSDPKTKKVMMEEQKWVTVFKKQTDGSWKAVADIFNADAPAMADQAK